jgi:hypothetical protein
MIERKPVVGSSNIISMGHCPDTNTLAVEFNGGAVYHYLDCPKTVYEEALAAKSIGKHFHANIKGAYKFEKQE